jgi:hypothetical protein
MASYSVGIDRSRLPEEEERHGPGDTTMGTMAVPVEREYLCLYTGGSQANFYEARFFRTLRKYVIII